MASSDITFSKATLYYGNGSCSIEGNNIAGVQINYRGRVKITDKSPEGYHLMSNNNMILVFPLGSRISLGELFEYLGELKIVSIIVSDNKGNEIKSTIKKVMDYSELLDTKAEDLTIMSENIKAGYMVGNKMSKTSSDKSMIENLNTNDIDGELFLKNNVEYHGDFHIHKSDGKAMTEATHSDSSEDLYIKRTTLPSQPRDNRLVNTSNSMFTRTEARKRGG